MSKENNGSFKRFYKTLIENLSAIPKSFQLLGRAFKYSKRDFWISIQVLFWISLVLSIIFYFVEHTAQPEVYRNWWQAVVWTVTRYIGDPGHFAVSDPVTIVGRHIDTFIGILNILIFAVPAGLLASGFLKAMEEDSREKHLQECRKKIQKSFKRVLNTDTKFRVAPRNISLVSLQAKKDMTENDIVDTVSKFDEFRLRNSADAESRSEHPHDRLVIEMLPLNEKTVDGTPIVVTKYGIKIDRGSNVTIVAPTADNHLSIGHFAYYLSQFGGFNLISRLFVPDVDERLDYYAPPKEDKDKGQVWEEPLRNFVDDLKKFSGSSEKWTIVVTVTKKAPEAQLHFAHKNSEGVSKTTIDEAPLQALYAKFTDTIQSKYNLRSDMDSKEFQAIGNRNISVVAGAGDKSNAFILRLTHSFVTWTERWTPILVDMADAIRECMDGQEQKEMYAQDSEDRKEREKSWKMKGIGLGEGKMQSFEDAGKKDSKQGAKS